MNVPIYEFSKAFYETRKNIDWVSQKYPEVLTHPSLRQQIAQKGLWISGGFPGMFEIYRATTSLPTEIVQAVKGRLFEIHNRYRPEPGAEVLLKNGISVEQPPPKSIALIARKIEDHCILAVATGQLDDEGRDRIVGYRCFWLNGKDLNQSGQSDGILTLVRWWFKNGTPCFNMNPNSFSSNVLWETSIQNTTQPPYLDEIEDFPPLIESNQNSNLIFTEIEKLHQLALAANENFRDCPLAWAWNVRRVTKPEEFAAISCTDDESFAYLTHKKSNLPQKIRKTAPLALPPSNDDDDRHGDASARYTVEDMQEQEKSGTTAYPDSLLMIKELKFHLKNISRNPENIKIFKDFLKFYFDHYDHYISEVCWDLLEQKTERYKNLANIKHQKDIFDAYLLYIFGFVEEDSKKLNLKNFAKSIKAFEQRDIFVVDHLLRPLFSQLDSLKKNTSFKSIYNYYQEEYEYFTLKISDLLISSERWSKSPIKSIKDAVNSFFSRSKNKSKKEHRKRENPDARDRASKKQLDSQNPSLQNQSNVGIPNLLGSGDNETDPPQSPSSTTVSIPKPHTEPIDTPPPSEESKYMNLKVVISMVALTILGLVVIVVFENPFSNKIKDIDSHWAKEPIKFLVKNKIFTVDEQSNFSPDIAMTRGDYATVLAKAFSLESCSDDFELKTEDLQSDNDNFENIKKVVCNGNFVQGDKFSPDEEVSQLSVLISLTKQVQSTSTSSTILVPSFYQQINTYNPEIKKKIITAIREGLIVNYENPCQLELNKQSTRAEVAAMVYQALVSNGEVQPIILLPKNPNLEIEDKICDIQQLEARHKFHQIKAKLEQKIKEARDSLKQELNNEAAINALRSTKVEPETREKIDQFFLSLVPKKELKTYKKPEELKTLRRNDQKEQEKKDQIKKTQIQYLKATLDVVNLYEGKIDENFDGDFEKIIQIFQKERGLKNPNSAKVYDGEIGSGTWDAFSDIFQNAHIVVAYTYFMNQLDSEQPLNEILQSLKNCKYRGPLQYVYCVKYETHETEGEEK